MYCQPWDIFLNNAENKEIDETACTGETGINVNKGAA
jgi:hypothetical protein